MFLDWLSTAYLLEPGGRPERHLFSIYLVAPSENRCSWTQGAVSVGFAAAMTTPNWEWHSGNSV